MRTCAFIFVPRGHHHLRRVNLNQFLLAGSCLLSQLPCWSPLSSSIVVADEKLFYEWMNELGCSPQLKEIQREYQHIIHRQQHHLRMESEWVNHLPVLRRKANPYTLARLVSCQAVKFSLLLPVDEYGAFRAFARCTRIFISFGYYHDFYPIKGYHQWIKLPNEESVSIGWMTISVFVEDPQKSAKFHFFCER